MTAGRLISGLCVLVSAGVLGSCGGSSGANGSGGQKCMVTASGNQVCGQAAAAWCQATDAVRSNSINSGLLPTNEKNTLKQTQSDCQTIEATYGGSTGSAGSSDSTGGTGNTGNGTTGTTPDGQTVTLGQSCTPTGGGKGVIVIEGPTAAKPGQGDCVPQ
jgi:hypothetical protein